MKFMFRLNSLQKKKCHKIKPTREKSRICLMWVPWSLNSLLNGSRGHLANVVTPQNPGVPLTNRQHAEDLWISGDPIPHHVSHLPGSIRNLTTK